MTCGLLGEQNIRLPPINITLMILHLSSQLQALIFQKTIIIFLDKCHKHSSFIRLFRRSASQAGRVLRELIQNSLGYTLALMKATLKPAINHAHSRLGDYVFHFIHTGK